MSSNYSPLPDDALRFVRALWRADEVREVRVLKCDRFGRTASGYFDTPEKLVEAAAEWEGKANVYITINATDPALLARADNRMVAPAQFTTADAEIAQRTWLFLDIDSVRPSGISATEAELAEAKKVLNAVSGYLGDIGWPPPITCLSGNGYYALFPIELPNTAETRTTVQEVLETLAARFNTAAATIDTTVANASRIACLIGTTKRKGDPTAVRPHRRSRLLNLPDELAPVSLGLLESLVGERVDLRRAAVAAPDMTRPLAELLDAAGIDYRLQPADANGSVWYHVRACPFHGPERPYECGVGQAPDGRYLGKCFHPEGVGKGWREWKAALGLDGLKPLAGEARATSGEPSSVRRHCTDSGNAERLIDLFGDSIRYCPAWGQWLVWEGRRWAKDDVLGIEHLAGRALLSIYAEAANAPDKEQRETLSGWAHMRIGIATPRHHRVRPQRPTHRHPPRPARCRPVVVQLHEWDDRPEVRPTSPTPPRGPSDQARAGGVRPRCRAPLWERVLDEATDGNEEMKAFLARLAGYSLTGFTTEEKLPFVYGPGATSKSTFLEALKSTWGDYAQTADFETFLKRNSTGSPRTDLARLAGARLVISIESEAGTRLADGFVKMITGGDRLVARKLYHDEFEFKPQFTMWWAANDAPKMSDRDGALWRRILEIPFTHQIPESERDPKVKAKLTDPAAAGPAILAWAVRGCLAWQKDGLGVPPLVEQATAMLREEMNPLRDFFAERCRLDPQVFTLSKTLYGSYKQWGGANNERNLLTRREFGLRVGDLLRCPPKHSRAGDGWQGITLIDESVQQALDAESGS